jgi:hypothetical protein
MELSRLGKLRTISVFSAEAREAMSSGLQALEENRDTQIWAVALST